MKFRGASLLLSLLLLGTPALAQSQPADDADILDPEAAAGPTTTPPSRGQTAPVTAPDRGQGAPVTAPDRGQGARTGQQRPTGLAGTGQAGQGGGDDDDVLNPGTMDRPATGDAPTGRQTQPGPTATDRPLEEVADARRQAPTPPPAEEKARLDAAIRDDIGARAEQYGRELRRVEEATRRDPASAERVVDGPLTESGRDLEDAMRDFDSAWSRGGASGEVEDVAAEVRGEGRRDGGSGRSGGRVAVNGGLRSEDGANDPSDGWGDPIPTTGAAPADERMSWWQKLMLAVLEGVHGGVKQLGENRANELKLRAEMLALSTDAAYRPYVDYESRRAIENSAFSRGGYDSRLNDLILGNNRQPLTPTAPTATTSATSPTGVVPTWDTSKAPLRVSRLPRQRDPISGEERVYIDLPLGVDPARPLR